MSDYITDLKIHMRYHKVQVALYVGIYLMMLLALGGTGLGLLIMVSALMIVVADFNLSKIEMILPLSRERREARALARIYFHWGIGSVIQIISTALYMIRDNYKGELTTDRALVVIIINLVALTFVFALNQKEILAKYHNAPRSMRSDFRSISKIMDTIFTFAGEFAIVMLVMKMHSQNYLKYQFELCIGVLLAGTVFFIGRSIWLKRQPFTVDIRNFDAEESKAWLKTSVDTSNR
ncbi:MAG: hypothetical protein MJ153_09160 [Clostridia bacterium]|nr:hypothetical protein [Clostridia bacterium]